MIYFQISIFEALKTTNSPMDDTMQCEMYSTFDEEASIDMMKGSIIGERKELQ